MANQAPARKTQSNGSPSRWPSFLRWPVFLIANVAILLLVGVSTLRETYRGWTVDREIQALQAQADSLEGRKTQLMQLSDSLGTPDQVALDARTKLGWKKDGEHVVVLSGYDVTSTWSDDGGALAAVPPAPPPLTNAERWWQYFFSHS